MSDFRRAIPGDVPGDIPRNAYTCEDVATVAVIPASDTRAIIMLHVKQPKAHRIVSLVKYAMEKHPHERMEAYARIDDEQANRLIEVCGFQHEGMMHKFHEGHDYNLYARVS